MLVRRWISPLHNTGYPIPPGLYPSPGNNGHCRPVGPHKAHTAGLNSCVNQHRIPLPVSLVRPAMVHGLPTQLPDVLPPPLILLVAGYDNMVNNDTFPLEQLSFYFANPTSNRGKRCEALGQIGFVEVDRTDVGKVTTPDVDCYPLEIDEFFVQPKLRNNLPRVSSLHQRFPASVEHIGLQYHSIEVSNADAGPLHARQG